MPGCRTRLALTWAFAGLAWTAHPVRAAPERVSDRPAALVGQYEGSQMEVGAGLELMADGHFHYELAYGALDEEAEGTWSVEGDRLVLASDPVTPPRFVVVSRRAAEPGHLRGHLGFKDGYDQQYFDALITKADGSTEQKQFGIEGLAWEFAPASPPRSVRVVNPIYGIAGEPLALEPGSDLDITWHFEPNGLGKVDISATPLRIEGGVLVMERVGRTLRFRRVPAEPKPGAP